MIRTGPTELASARTGGRPSRCRPPPDRPLPLAGRGKQRPSRELSPSRIIVNPRPEPAPGARRRNSSGGPGDGTSCSRAAGRRRRTPAACPSNLAEDGWATGIRRQTKEAEPGPGKTTRRDERGDPESAVWCGRSGRSARAGVLLGRAVGGRGYLRRRRARHSGATPPPVRRSGPRPLDGFRSQASQFLAEPDVLPAACADPVHRHAEGLFPPLDRAHAAAEVRGNLLPASEAGVRLGPKPGEGSRSSSGGLPVPGDFERPSQSAGGSGRRPGRSPAAPRRADLAAVVPPGEVEELQAERAGRRTAAWSATPTAMSTDVNSGNRESLRVPTTFHSSSIREKGKPDRTSRNGEIVSRHGSEMIPTSAGDAARRRSAVRRRPGKHLRGRRLPATVFRSLRLPSAQGPTYDT